MTDQTQRLEIATVRAEIGSNITYRFNNDAIDAGGIPTDSGDIKNLKLIIKEIEDKASVSTSIYPGVTEGLAATEEGGMFLVQSGENTEIYVVWRKVGGVAVDTGKRALSSQAAQDAVDSAQSSAAASASSALDAQEAASNAAGEFQVIFEADQISREDEFRAFMDGANYESTYLIYGVGIVVERQTQLTQREGELYRVMNASDIPLTLTGTWATDAPKLQAVGDAALRQQLESDAGMIIRYTAPIPGAVNRALIDKFMEQITVKDFGAACTGLTDDTVFVQSAIDFCAANGWPPLVVPGRCLITAPLNIDRMVDSTTSEFRIIAKGANAGFHTTTSIEMFTSRIPMTTFPVSEFVTFEGVMFTCDNHVTAPRVLSKKFLRMKFLSCYFSKVRFMVSDVYAQSFFLSNCNIRAWQSSWFVADHAFDVDFDGCISEFGNGYLAVIPNGCYGVRFRGGVHEGSAGGLITAGLARSLLVSGYYGEGNNKSFLEFGAGGQNTNITVLSTWISSTADNIANPNFYEINWGSTLNPVSIGNSAFNGRLHDDALLPATTTAPILYSTGDSAGLTLYKTPYFADKGAGSWPLAIGTGGGTVNYAKYVRSGTQIDVEFSFVFSGASGSPAVITGLPLSSVNAFIVGTVSYSDQTGEVYLIGGAGAGNGCTGSSFAVCKTKQGAAYSYTELNGKLIVGRISYMI